MASDRPSLMAQMKDGFTLTPGWAAIFVTLILAAVAAGATGLQTSAATDERVRAHGERLDRIEHRQEKTGQDVAYIRARIDGFMREAADAR